MNSSTTSPAGKKSTVLTKTPRLLTSSVEATTRRPSRSNSTL